MLSRIRLNGDQGSQFTSSQFTSILETHGVAISMDGRGRAVDDVLVERLWRTIKYEHVYLNPAPAGANSEGDSPNTSSSTTQNVPMTDWEAGLPTRPTSRLWAMNPNHLPTA